MCVCERERSDIECVRERVSVRGRERDRVERS